MIADPRLHRGGDSQGLMNPAEVVMHVVNGNGRDVVLDLLGESIGQSGESAHGHSHGEIWVAKSRLTAGASRFAVGIRLNV